MLILDCTLWGAGGLLDTRVPRCMIAAEAIGFPSPALLRSTLELAWEGTCFEVTFPIFLTRKINSFFCPLNASNSLYLVEVIKSIRDQTSSKLVWIHFESTILDGVL